MKGSLFAQLLLSVIALGCISSTSDVSHHLRYNKAVKSDISAATSQTLLRDDDAISRTSLIRTLARARRKALAGGLSGFIAGAIQVITLMWLRTTVNYQYRYGVSMMTALRELHRQGGLRRFYRGLPYAIIQGPLARFGGIAANDASIVFSAYLMGQPELSSKGILSTALGSIMAGCLLF